ncbi:MAG: hypothetical protein M3Z09_17300 [Acidobacteriota bacterium]|nr:hypothetical protein [Acidobacteriota bacterium]
MPNKSRFFRVLLPFLLAWTVLAGVAGFRSRGVLLEHFEKHGAEFGRITPEQYLHLAQALRDAPVGGTILQSSRPGGGFAKYDRGSNAFGAYDADGTVRTFFRPNDGERYFLRQQRNRNRYD